MKLNIVKIVPATIVAGLFFCISIAYQAHGISGGDSGDLVTAAATFGVAHPPGYPLYTFLGLLLNQLPVSSPAFRVAFLSSVTHAVVLLLLFTYVQAITKKLFPAFISAISLSSTYLFFYYSITPEVFALLDLFLIVLLGILYKYSQKHQKKYLYLGVFVFFLSLTHHHFILFIVPPVLLTLLLNSQIIKIIRKSITKKDLLILLGLALIGLLPYVYAIVAGSQDSMINWNKPNTLSGFIRLIRRADYGTFQSGGFYGELPIHRFLSIKAFFEFLLMDFGIVGLSLFVLGQTWLLKARRLVGVFSLFVWLSFGPIFFFYASFPIINGFMLGTFERFLLPSYTVISLLIGVGAYVINFMVSKWLNSENRSRSMIQITTLLVMCLLLLSPVNRLRRTFIQMQGIAQDQTANNLGRDILMSTKSNAILLMGNDTPLFTTQYMRYAEGLRADTKVFHANSLMSPDYLEVMKTVFPELSVPASSSATVVADFILANKSRYPIYSNMNPAQIDGYVWVPRGILRELTPTNALTSIAEFATESASIFSKYQNPRQGVLRNYSHLMLQDILDVYGFAYIKTGVVLEEGGLLPEAWEYFQKAIDLKGDASLVEAYTKRGTAEFFMGKCSQALESFNLARTLIRDGDESEILGFEAATYQECLKDEVQAKIYLEKYENARKQKEKILDQWQ